MKKIKYLFFLVTLTACAGAPRKDFKTLQYLNHDGNCFERKLSDDSFERKCYYDDGTDEEADWIVIRKSDFNKELDYQDKLIYSCKTWKKLY